MYSLGVIPIKIVLWQSFIVSHKELEDTRPNEALWGMTLSSVEGERVMAHLEKLAKLEGLDVIIDKYRSKGDSFVRVSAG